MMKRKTGFTIIELLTVMSIIVVLISLLVPSLNAVRKYSRVVAQKGQFHNLNTGLEMFSIDFDGYPDSIDSGYLRPPRPPYCGAMRLCEAMLGQDGFGFHPDSRFYRTGWSGPDSTGIDLYIDTPPPLSDAERRKRKDPYIEIVGKYKMYALENLYGIENTGVFDPNSTVISDVFYRIRGQTTDDKLGMPVLYYKADVGKLLHDPDITAVDNNIYDYQDNDYLLELRVPDNVDDPHPMDCNSPLADVFYEAILGETMGGIDRPHNENSYILISAGWDGLYGTRDDVYNFAE